MFGSPLDALLHSCRADWPTGPICVGGATLYRAYAGLFTEAHVTLVDGEYEGDTYFPFPLLDSPEWEPAAEPTFLAGGVTYHKLRRKAVS